MMTQEHESILRKFVLDRISNAKVNIQGIKGAGHKIEPNHLIFKIPDLTLEAKALGLGKQEDGVSDIPSPRDFAALLNGMADEGEIEKNNYIVRVFKQAEFDELFGE